MGEIEIQDLLHGELAEDRDRGNADPLGDLRTELADKLDAEELPGSPIAGVAHRDLLTGRVVGLVPVVREAQ